ncbi:alpha/beta fold hydrolase [Actinomadura litoris]|uniref:Alpha/beta fold hydrolase n=1 Tax=Actinomadura litoris TaxID=2678616 RepID=A0A7K1LE35_9ACTN|nr:alpha/beta hydrolase [Actinomadura litoris]MUN42526.1 alpha/beta fold hydrolase [Actinomadura litoris]
MNTKRNLDGAGARRPARGLGLVIGAVVAVAALLFGTTAATASPASRPAALPGQGDLAGLRGFRHGFVPVDGGSLHYVKGGQGPALVLLHGWPETWYEWHEVMPELAKTHTVIAFDLPGLGRSSIPTDRKYDLVTVAAKLHQGVTRLGYDNVAILGHDVGALVAYPYARNFPGGVSRMAVLEAPLNGFGLESAYGLSWHFQFNMTAAPVPEQLVNDRAHVSTYLGWLFAAAKYPKAIAQSTYIDAYSDAAHRSAGFDYYRAYPTNAADNKRLAEQKLTIPVLAMGAADVFGPAVGQSFGAVATDVRTVVAPDSGHWIPEENPAFLQQCSALFFGGADTKPTTPELAGCAR